MGVQLKQRIIMSTLSIFCLTFAIYYSHTTWFELIFVGLSTLIICSAVYEYYKLAINKGYQPLMTAGLGCAALYVISSYLSLKYENLHDLPLIILLAGLILFFFKFCRNQKNTIPNIAITAFGLIYLVLPLTCILLINYFKDTDVDHGRLWLTNPEPQIPYHALQKRHLPLRLIRVG